MTPIKDMPENLRDLRAQIEVFRAKRREIQSAPTPRYEAVEYVESVIKLYSSRWLGQTGLLTQSGANPGAFKLTPGENVDAMLCWLFPELIHERLLAEIDRQLEERPPGLPMGERPDALAELDAAIRKLGIEEEALIVEAEVAGIELDRRGDADPRIVLAVEEEETFTPPKPPEKRPKTKRSKRRWSEWDGGSGAVPQQKKGGTRI